MKELLLELGFEQLPMLSEFVEANQDQSNREFYGNVIAYTEFITQPLVKGMLIPCDENGNALEEPICYGTGDEQYYGSRMDEYQQAKKCVIFNEWEYRECNTTKGIDNIKCHTFEKDGMILRLDDDGEVAYGKPGLCERTDIKTIEHAINKGVKLNTPQRLLTYVV